MFPLLRIWNSHVTTAAFGLWIGVNTMTTADLMTSRKVSCLYLVILYGSDGIVGSKPYLRPSRWIVSLA